MEHAEDGASVARFDRQARQYSFPYHWLVEEQGGRVAATRTMSWGLEYAAVLAAVAEGVAELEPARILDVGCGDGRAAVELLRATSATVVGVDPVAQAIAFARAFHGEDERVRFVSGVVEDLDEHGFDVATLIEVLEHIPEPAIPSLVAGIRERLASGGHLVVSVPTVVLPTNAKHERHYDLALLEQHLGDAFGVESVRYVHRVSAASRLIERATANRLFALTHPRLQGALTARYRRSVRHASADDGAHLVARCVAR